MLTKQKYSIVVWILLQFCGFYSLKAQNVEVLISGIRSSKGEIRVGVYKDDKSFKDDTPYLRIEYKKTEISDGEITIYLNLSPGTYGLALLDDENNDDKMNYNLIGMPKEGFGFSNYYHTGLSNPKFDSFSFMLIKDQQVKIICKIRYM